MAVTRMTIPAKFDKLDSREARAYLESIAANSLNIIESHDALPIHTAVDINLVGDGSTDDGTALNTYLAGLALTGGGHLQLISPVQAALDSNTLSSAADPNSYSFYINSTVDIPSNTRITWGSPVLLGPLGKFRIKGSEVSGESSLLASDAVLSSTQIQLESSGALKFDIGDWVLISDTQTVSQYVDILQPASTDVTDSTALIHREVFQLIAVDKTTDIITLDRGVSFPYSTTYTATVQLLTIVENSSIEKAQIKFAYDSEPSDSTTYPIEISYARNCSVDSVIIDSRYDTGSLISGKSPGLRINLSNQCTIQNSAVINPQYTDTTEGYGVLLEASHGCRVHNFYASGCRHSVTLFQSACHNQITNITSVDARVSDINLKGAFENNNLIKNIFCVSGERQSEDSVTTKTAIKIGDIYHLAGAHNNVIEYISIHNLNNASYTNKAIEIIPTSSKNIIRNLDAWSGEYGLYCRDIAAGSPSILTSDENIIQNCTFYDTSKYVIDIDNTENLSTTDVTDGLILRGITDVGSANGVRIIQANDILIDNFISKDSLGTVAHVMTLDSINNLKICNSHLWKANKGLSITDCPGFTVRNLSFDGLTGSTVFTDGGGNTNYNWVDCDYTDTTDAAFASLSSTREEERHARQINITEVAGYTDDGTPLTTIIPLDDTTPLVTEGTEIASVTITPTNPTTKFIIHGFVPVAITDVAGYILVTLFNGSTFLGVDFKYLPALQGGSFFATGTFEVTTTDAVTISMRLGPDASASITVGSKWGTEGHPYMRIYEVNR